MLKIHKKGTTTLEMMLKIADILFFTVVVVTLTIFINIFIVEQVDGFDSESNVFVQRILFSKELNYFYEDIERTDYGLIDFQKFSSEDFERMLEEEISYGQTGKISSSIVLKNIDTGEFHEIFYKKDLYEEKKVLAEAGLNEGPGGAKSLTKDVLVRIKKENIIQRGLLTIEVVIPNS